VRKQPLGERWWFGESRLPGVGARSRDDPTPSTDNRRVKQMIGDRGECVAYLPRESPRIRAPCSEFWHPSRTESASPMCST
jgi:hypothetical protein